MNLRALLPFLPVLVPAVVSADVWISNFTTASGGTAEGVWRNYTTSTDTGLSVFLDHSGGSVFDEETVLDNTRDWQDFIVNLFEPNYVGDSIVLELAGGVTSSVVIDFGAEVVNPVLHFSDIDVQTTLRFATANPTAVAGAPNLVVSGNEVTTSGVNVNPFDPTDFETLGSLQFTGTFTQLAFEIINVGPSPTEDDDRTGFSVSTLQEPVPTTTGPLPRLDVWQAGGRIYLSWPDTSSFSEIEFSTDLTMMSWAPLPGADPTTSTDWNAPLSDFSGQLYIRGRYKF